MTVEKNTTTSSVYNKYNTMKRAQAQSVTFLDSETTVDPPHEYEMVSPSSSAITNEIDETKTTNNTTPTTTTTTNTIVDEAQECLAQALLMFLYADLRLLSATGRINTRFETLR